MLKVSCQKPWIKAWKSTSHAFARNQKPTEKDSSPAGCSQLSHPYTGLTVWPYTHHVSSLILMHPPSCYQRTEAFAALCTSSIDSFLPGSLSEHWDKTELRIQYKNEQDFVSTELHLFISSCDLATTQNMSSEFACPVCDQQFRQALVFKGEIHDHVSSLRRALELYEGERPSCRPTFFGRTSKACTARDPDHNVYKLFTQCLLSLSLSLSGIRRLKLYNLCLWQESSQSKLKSSISRKEQESFSCLETSNVYVSWLLWFLDSFRLFVSQAENQAEKHAEHKIWRRRKYISCKQCHCCKLTLHLLSRTLYSSPPSQNSLVHFNPVNPFQEPVSRINQRSSAPSSELDSSCLFLLLSAIWQQPRMPPQVTLMSMYSHLVHVPSAVCLFVEPCLAIDLGGRPFLMIQYSLNRVCICALAAWCTIFRIESLANTHTHRLTAIVSDLFHCVATFLLPCRWRDHWTAESGGPASSRAQH